VRVLEMEVLDRAARRALDIVVAVTVLLIAVPLLFLVALAVVIESPGPVLYAAERVGRRRVPLRMLKFRKMPVGAAGLPLTTDADGRLTHVGRFLARTRLDELPQLWHVLCGEMSLVGPRPEDPVFVAARADDYDVILTIRPGLTGFTQLAFADERRILSDTDPMRDYLERLQPQKCRLDRLYVERASLRTNLRILVWTLAVTLLRLPVAVDRETGAIGRRRRPAELAERAARALTGAAVLLAPTPPQADAAPASYAETAAASASVARIAQSREAASPPVGMR
jgi:lipopolysaccharide/colanic/teichoic acid biosynthesis glycosyltransferase